MEILKIGDDAGAIQSQQGRPMGRFAGRNVVCDLFAKPMLPLRIDVTPGLLGVTRSKDVGFLCSEKSRIRRAHMKVHFGTTADGKVWNCTR